MTALTVLWLPILLSAVFVFIVSSVIHMAPLWHKNDFPLLSNQDQITGALRPFAVPPGEYMFPRAKDMKDMRSPEFAEKMRTGPVVMITFMRPGPISMNKPLTLWFIFVLVTSAFAAYVGSRALPPGASSSQIFQIVGTTAFVAYALGLWPASIWYGRPVSTTIKSTFDGVIFAVITAATFAWLWPR